MANNNNNILQFSNSCVNNIQNYHYHLQDPSDETAVLLSWVNRGPCTILCIAVNHMSSVGTKESRTTLVAGARAFRHTVSKTLISFAGQYQTRRHSRNIRMKLKTHLYRLLYYNINYIASFSCISKHMSRNYCYISCFKTSVIVIIIAIAIVICTRDCLSP